MGDPDGSKLLQKLAQDVHEESKFSLTDGILKFRTRIYIGAATEFRQTLLNTFHNSAIGGHFGIRATMHRLKKHFYWPNMKKMWNSTFPFVLFVNSQKWNMCILLGYLTPWKSLQSPGLTSLDFIEALLKSQGEEVIFVVVDRLTKYAHFLPMSHPYSVQPVIQLFLDNIVKLHGMHVVIVSDRDGIFTNKFYLDILTSFEVKLSFSTTHIPNQMGRQRE